LSETFVKLKKTNIRKYITFLKIALFSDVNAQLKQFNTLMKRIKWTPIAPKEQELK
jgi:hypothetical protein